MADTIPVDSNDRFCPQCGLGNPYHEDGVCSHCGASTCSYDELRRLLAARGLHVSATAPGIQGLIGHIGPPGDDMTDGERAQVAANVRTTRLALSSEGKRLDFIRSTAGAYFATLENVLSQSIDPTVFADVWSEARALWDAKPEDC